VVFVVALLVLAIAFPNPTPFQYNVFRIILALAAAGFAATIPGFISVEIGTWLRAGGALAVFAIVYFYNPAQIVAQPSGPSLSQGAAVPTVVARPAETLPASTPTRAGESLVADKPSRTAEDALYDVFDFAAYKPDWRGASRGGNCRERWEWRVDLGSREITSNLARLNFNFICHRRNFCYDCGGGYDCVSSWSLHDWPGRVTADLKVEGDTVIVSNVQSPEAKFDAECEAELMDLIRAKNGAKVRS
jgi:hypothetical protein